MSRAQTTRILGLCAVGFAGLMSSACTVGRVAFLHGHRAPKGLEDEQLKNLQFYVSRDIVLRRDVDTSEYSVTEDATYVVVNGRLVDEIILPEWTPGLIVKATKKALWLSFEKEGSLKFEFVPDEAGYPMIADDKNLNTSFSYRFSAKPGTKVKYNNKTYEVISGGLGDEGDTFLLVDMTSLERSENTSRTLPGRLISEK